MPEPKGVEYEMAHPENWFHIEQYQDLTCAQLVNYPPGSVFVWSFYETAPVPALRACSGALLPQLHSNPQGQPLFHAATLRVGVQASPGAVLPPPTSNAAALDPNALGGGAAASGPLAQAELNVSGAPARVRISAPDIGSLPEAFDGNAQTLLRGARDNPFIIELEFAPPRSMAGVALTLGTMTNVHFKANFVFADGNVETVELESTTLPPDPRVELLLSSGTKDVLNVRVEILDRRQPPGEGFHTHVREVEVVQ
jgi:prepilin-type processing-associated H-X9-DG protein